MNKIFLSILLNLLMTTGTYASGIEFFEGTWAEAKEKAKQENKLIFVDAYTIWCGPCKWMGINTFPDEEVGMFYNANFISVKLDMEKEGDGVAFAKAYNVKAFPSLLYIDADGEVMHLVVGGLDPKSFISHGEVALDPEKRLTTYEEKYKTGKRDPEFIRSYLKMLSDANMDLKEVADWYFFTQTEEDLLSKENFETIRKTVTDVSAPQFQFVINHYDSYKKLVKAEDVDDYIREIFSNSLFYASFQENEVYQQKINEIKATGSALAEKILAQSAVDKSFYGNNDDITKKANAYLRNYEWDNAESLNHYAFMVTMIMDITDKKIIKEGITWIKRAMELDGSYTCKYTYASLLYRAGKRKKAMEVANIALEMAENEEDSESIEKISFLIKKIEDM